MGGAAGRADAPHRGRSSGRLNALGCIIALALCCLVSGALLWLARSAPPRDERSRITSRSARSSVLRIGDAERDGLTRVQAWCDDRTEWRLRRVHASERRSIEATLDALAPDLFHVRGAALERVVVDLFLDEGGDDAPALAARRIYERTPGAATFTARLVPADAAEIDRDPAEPGREITYARLLDVSPYRLLWFTVRQAPGSAARRARLASVMAATPLAAVTGPFLESRALRFDATYDGYRLAPSALKGLHVDVLRALDARLAAERKARLLGLSHEEAALEEAVQDELKERGK